MIDRVPPQSFESEQAVLGSALISRAALVKARTILQAGDFYSPHNRRVWQACCYLDGKGQPIDLTTVAQALGDKGLLEPMGGRPYLAGLLDAVPTAEHVEHYAGIVKHKALLRSLIRIGEEMAEECYADAEDAEDVASRRALEIHKAAAIGAADPLVTVQDAIDGAMERYEYLAAHPNECSGIRTGLSDLDRYTKGLQRGDFNVIAGRPSMGKSALGMTIFTNMLRSGVKAQYFSLEMTREQNNNRIVQALAEVDGWRLREPANLRQDDWDRMTRARASVGEALGWLDCSSRTPERIRDKARRVAGEAGLDAIFIDHFHEVRWHGRTASEVDRLSHIADALKDLAVELNVVLVCMAQLNRDVEKRGGRRPNMADLQGTGKLEQNAAFIGLLFRESYYEQQKAQAEGKTWVQPEADPTQLIIGKARHDGPSMIPLTFQPRFARFTSLARNGSWED